MQNVFNLFSDFFFLLRKNYFLFLFSVLSLLLSQLVVFINRKQIALVSFLGGFVFLFGNALIDLLVILIVYNISKILPKANNIFQYARLYFQRVLGIYIVGGVITLLLSVFLFFPFLLFFSFESLATPNFIFWFFTIVFGILDLAFVRLAIQSLIVKNGSVWESIKTGFRELSKNLHFYIQVFLGTTILVVLFNLFVYLVMSFMSLVDHKLLYPVARQVSSSLASPLTTIVITMAFLFKNSHLKNNSEI